MPLPCFWRDETSGVLAPVIEDYLHNRIKLEDVPVMRAYLRQWTDSPAWDANPDHDNETRAELAQLRRTAAAIQTIPNIRTWLAIALDFGIDPL